MLPCVGAFMPPKSLFGSSLWARWRGVSCTGDDGRGEVGFEGGSGGYEWAADVESARAGGEWMVGRSESLGLRRWREGNGAIVCAACAGVF